MITRTAVDIERMRIRADICTRVCAENVWDKFPTNDGRDLFLWHDDRCQKAARDYVISLKGADIDKCDRAYDELLNSCKGLMELFEWKGIVTMAYFTYAGMLVDIFEYTEIA